MTRLIWRPMALADRKAIMDYIAQNNRAAAMELDDDFEVRAEQIRQQPKSYKVGRVKGTREIVVRPNYVIVYCIEDKEKTVAILRVLHTARHWPENFDSELTYKK